MRVKKGTDESHERLVLILLTAFLLIICIIAMTFFISAVAGQVVDDSDAPPVIVESWQWEFNNKVLWIGETLTVNVTGQNNTFIRIEFTGSNITFGESLITDENGTAYFAFPLELEMRTGSYAAKLYTEQITPVLITGIEISHDIDSWQSMQIEELVDADEDFMATDTKHDNNDVALRDTDNTQYQIIIFLFVAMLMFVLFITWVLEDEIKIKFHKMNESRKGKSMPGAGFLTFTKGAREHDNRTANHKVPTFPKDDKLGRGGLTKHEAEERRREKMRKKRIEIKEVDLTKPDPPKPIVEVIKDVVPMRKKTDKPKKKFGRKKIKEIAPEPAVAKERLSDEETEVEK